MSYLMNLINEYGLLAMFFIILLEYACFPVSSEIVLPFSGAMASIQNIDFFLILPVSIVAGLIGTSICYTIGRYGGGPLLDKLMRRFPKTEKGIQSSYDRFEKYGTFAVCLGRMIPLCRTYIAFIAGAAKQNFLTYLCSSFFGITIWNTILIGLGYFFRENWKVVSSYYDQYKAYLNPVFIVIGVLILIKLKPFQKKST